MNARAKFVATALGGVAIVAVTGCGQIASLKQVSGVPLTTLQIAVSAVVIDNNVPVLIAPVCAQDAADATKFACNGKTTTGEEILATATGGTANTFTLAPGGTPTPEPDGTLDLQMVVKVGSKVIYQGQAQSVIDKDSEVAK